MIWINTLPLKEQVAWIALCTQLWCFFCRFFIVGQHAYLSFLYIVLFVACDNEYIATGRQLMFARVHVLSFAVRAREICIYAWSLEHKLVNRCFKSVEMITLWWMIDESYTKQKLVDFLAFLKRWFNFVSTYYVKKASNKKDRSLIWQLLLRIIKFKRIPRVSAVYNKTKRL